MWEHTELIVESIKDPDALAEAACSAGLVNQDAVTLLQGWSGDAKAKTRSLLQIIEGKVKDQRHHFLEFLTVLRSLRLTELVSRLQNSYGQLYLVYEFNLGGDTIVFLADYRLMGRLLPDHHATDGLTEDQSSVSDAESDSVDDSEISSHTGINENA